MISRRSLCPAIHNSAPEVTQIYLVTPVLRICIQPNHLWGFFSFLSFDICLNKQDQFCHVIVVVLLVEDAFTAFIFITLPTCRPWVWEVLEGLKSFSMSPVTKNCHLPTEIIPILSLWTAESDGCAQSSCQWQWKDHRWNELASDIPLHLVIQQNLTAVANARSLWEKLCYEYLTSRSFKFTWFSEYVLSQVTWDKEWLSPNTYKIDVQRVSVNQCWRKASFKVCLLVSWERAIQWVCFIMLTAA